MQLAIKLSLGYKSTIATGVFSGHRIDAQTAMAFAHNLTHLAARASKHTKADIEAKGAKQDLYTRDLWLFLASLIAFFSLVNVVKKLSLALTTRAPVVQGKEEGEVVRAGTTGKVSLRRFPAAVASSFRILALRTSIPLPFGASTSAFEAGFIALYMAVVLVLLLIDSTQKFSTSFRDLTLTLAIAKSLDIWQYEDRAAHFASAQLPLIVALAGKNNVISFLVGVGHEKVRGSHSPSQVIH